jgi:hypothetical protein
VAGDDASSASGNRRALDRLEILGDLRGEITVFQAMLLREISPTGAQIETAFPLQLHSLHDVRLVLGSRAVVVKARVAHCRISDVDQEVVSYRSGLEFVEPSERVGTEIRAFIDTVRAGRGASRGTT